MGNLPEFLINECRERGLSWRQASLKAGLDHSAISRFVRGTQPNPESCAKLAGYFGYNPDHILVLAGHRTDEYSEFTRNKDTLFISIWNRLNPDDQERVLRFARILDRTQN
jgi:transcriptional regulator with XRE-family HTH domain